jgi:hypothetical protein
MAFFTYTLKTFKADGSTSRIWSFEATDEEEAKAKLHGTFASKTCPWKKVRASS